MSLALAAALAFTPAATFQTCSWDKPGNDPFMGNVVEAVERYTNIPPDLRDRLKQRMAARQYDEIVTIRRDSISGLHRYAPDIRDMHFGNGRVCRTVSRAAWAPSAMERGLVYCEGEHCIIVPTVCRNVSRITRLPPDKPTLATAPMAPSMPGPAGAGTLGVDPTPLQEGKPALLAMNGMPDNGELVFDPPGAGMPGTDGGRSAIQSALAGVATAGPLGAGGSVSGGGIATAPGIDFNPYPPILGGGGGGSFSPATPATEPAPTPTPTPSPLTPAAPGTPIDVPGLVPPVVPLLPPLIDPTPAVPEPGTWALWAAGLAALALHVRRKAPGPGAGLRS